MERLSAVLKRAITLVSVIILAFALSAGLSGCTGGEDETNPVQDFIEENRELLAGVSADHLISLGEGAGVEFLAGDGEFIYVYSFGPGYDTEEIREFSNALLSYPSNIAMYENLASELAELMELDSLLLTVRYLDSEGNLLATESFESR